MALPPKALYLPLQIDNVSRCTELAATQKINRYSLSYPLVTMIFWLRWGFLGRLRWRLGVGGRSGVLSLDVVEATSKGDGKEAY